jgi:hypothetical protein
MLRGDRLDALALGGYTEDRLYPGRRAIHEVWTQ